MEPGVRHGLVFSSKEKSAMRIKPAAVELLSHVKFESQMTLLPCHELQVQARANRRIFKCGVSDADEERVCRRGAATNCKTTGSRSESLTRCRAAVALLICEERGA
jgi:hypothetical protein